MDRMRYAGLQLGRVLCSRGLPVPFFIGIHFYVDFMMFRQPNGFTKANQPKWPGFMNEKIIKFPLGVNENGGWIGFGL